jgi:alkaline phosphatase D
MLKFIKFLLLIFFIKTINAQSIVPANAPFVQGQSMQFNYSGGTGATTDWIGIYKKGEIPGNISSTVWEYIPSTNGSITFEGNLDTGRYDIHLFCCDGYTKLASHLNFHIGLQRFKSRMTFYKTTDSLVFTANNTVVGDKISVYNASDFSNGMLLSGATALVEKTYINQPNGVKAVFAPNLSAGQYVGIFQSNLGNMYAFKSFEIKNAPTLPSLISRIGIGSCGNQSAYQPGLSHILTHDIDAFVLCGDNLYIDTYSPIVMKNEYENYLTNRQEFQKLRASVPLIATWDDHDYACCDEDVDNPIKVQSQQLFLDFFEEPSNSIRRTQSGIYTAQKIGPDGQKIQIILLDTRYFLDNKRPNNGCGLNDYCAWVGPGDLNKTMLGTAQWQWLKEALLEPADLRMIVTSVQFSSAYHGFEGWALFPYQRKKMQDLIKETQAEHVFFVSGDMHYTEVSKLNNDAALYPLYDFTSSGLNTTWPPEINANRVENKAYGQFNVGLVAIDWTGKTLTFKALNNQNTTQFEHIIPFEEMEFGTNSIHLIGQNVYKMQQIPSPSHAEAQLYFNEKITGVLQIYTTIGLLTRTQHIDNEDSIIVTGLNQGVYMAKITTNQNITIVGKILIE